MNYRYILLCLSLVLTLANCAKKHKRPTENPDEQRIVAGGSGGREIFPTGGTGGEQLNVGGTGGASPIGGEESSGGTGGEPGWVNPEPGFQERLISLEEPTPVQCIGSEQVLFNACDGAHVVIPEIVQTQPDRWIVSVCSNLSNALQSSCEISERKETVIQWTAPADGHYTFIFGSKAVGTQREGNDVVNISARTECDNINTELSCSNPTNRIRDHMQIVPMTADETLFWVIENQTDDDHLIHMIVQRADDSEAPSIISVSNYDAASEDSGRASFQINANDPNEDIISYHLEYFEDPNGPPLQLYEEPTPHGHENTIEEMNLHSSFVTLSQVTTSQILLSVFEGPVGDDRLIEGLPNTSYVRFRVEDSAGNLSEFSPILGISVESFENAPRFFTSPDAPQYGEPCEPSMEPIPSSSPSGRYFCQQAYDEESPTWKPKCSPLYFQEFEYAQAFIHKNILGTEIIVSKNFAETIFDPTFNGWGSWYRENDIIGRITVTEEDSLPRKLSQSISQVGEHRFRIRSAWMLPNTVEETATILEYNSTSEKKSWVLSNTSNENATASVNIDINPGHLNRYTECYDDEVYLSTLPFPILGLEERCDPALATNLCDEDMVCLPFEDHYTCQNSIAHNPPTIVSARIHFTNHIVDPELDSITANLEIQIEDPDDILFAVQYKRESSIDENRTGSTLPVIVNSADYRPYKQGDEYQIEAVETLRFDDENEDPRQERWYIQVFDQHGRTSSWIELEHIESAQQP